MVVPPAVAKLLGKTIIKVATHVRDIHRAATIAAPIIAGVKKTIKEARATLRPPLEIRAEELAFFPHRRQRDFRLELRTVLLPCTDHFSPLANRPFQWETLS
jgi:hypothetical protein